MLYQESAENYGIDWNEDVSPDEIGSVEVPLTRNPLSDEDYSHLCQTFNPLHINSDCDSIDVFCAVKDLVSSLVS